MPQIEPKVLNCAIYLYPSTEAARKGEKAGGSGFIVGIPTTIGAESGAFLYAITNRHVIEDARAPVVRLNTTANDFDILPLDPQEWVTHPAGEDVAACELRLEGKHRANYVSTRLFLTKQETTQWVIVGCDVHTVGRFVNHEGKQQNQPVVRFGHVAALPGDPIKQENGHRQLSYLVECHSTSGYSGSPVFVDVGSSHGAVFRFLGVAWGHLPDMQPVRLGDERHPDGWIVNGNSGMMTVVPAWMLRELLDEPRFLEARQAEEAALARDQEAKPPAQQEGP